MQSKIGWFYAEEKEQVLNAKWKKKILFFLRKSENRVENFRIFYSFFLVFFEKSWFEVWSVVYKKNQ